MKYVTLVSFLISSNGLSICLAPPHVRIKNEDTIDQKTIFFWGLNLHDDHLIFVIGLKNRIRILRTNAKTPPSLLGIERKIA
jgi:hypothetical protein